MRSDGETAHAEFLFGLLSTQDGRAGWSRGRQAGLRHEAAIEPRDPEPGEAVRVTLWAGPDTPVRDPFLVYTTDGSEPRLTDGRAVPLGRGPVVWETPSWGYRQAWTGTIPDSPPGRSSLRPRRTGRRRGDRRLRRGPARRPRLGPGVCLPRRPRPDSRLAP